MQFQYETCLVTNRNELEKLPFASDIQLEKQIFQLALICWVLKRIFVRGVKAWKLKLSILSFREVLPSLCSTWRIEDFREHTRPLSDSKPQVQISSKGSLLEIQFDFPWILIKKKSIEQCLSLPNRDYYISSSSQVYYFDEQTNVFVRI